MKKKTESNNYKHEGGGLSIHIHIIKHFPSEILPLISDILN